MGLGGATGLWAFCDYLGSYQELSHWPLQLSPSLCLCLVSPVHSVIGSPRILWVVYFQISQIAQSQYLPAFKEPQKSDLSAHIG